MIAAPLARYIRYWYTYRIAVAVVIALVLPGVMYFLYTQQLTCDARQTGCVVNLSVHPEDRFATQYDPGNAVVIVGIDDSSVQTLKQYPLPRRYYAQALENLQKAGAMVVAYDIGFTDPSGDDDKTLAAAFAASKVPVVLAYANGDAQVVNGKVVQQGLDQIPLRSLRCADANADSNAACTSPYPNVVLASTDLILDQDGVLRRIPLSVQPACFLKTTCSTAALDTFGFAAYRPFQLGQDFQTGPDLSVSNGTATFGQAWSTPVDGSGSILVNFSGPPGNFEINHHYLSFDKVVSGNFDADQVKDKIVMIGAYGLTGVHDEQLVTTSFGGKG